MAEPLLSLLLSLLVRPSFDSTCSAACRLLTACLLVRLHTCMAAVSREPGLSKRVACGLSACHCLPALLTACVLVVMGGGACCCCSSAAATVLRAVHLVAACTAYGQSQTRSSQAVQRRSSRPIVAGMCASMHSCCRCHAPCIASRWLLLGLRWCWTVLLTCVVG